MRVEESGGGERVDEDAVHLRDQGCEPPRGVSDQEQFTAFMTIAEPTLGRLAWLLIGDRHRAEELVQQALVRTWTAWPRAREADPLAYARRVLVNTRIDTWRARRREVPLEDHHNLIRPGAATAPSSRSPAQDLAERDTLVRALRALPARRRRVLVLRYLMDLPEQQVAEDLGITMGTVKSTAARAPAQLRAPLEPPHQRDSPSPASEVRR